MRRELGRWRMAATAVALMLGYAGGTAIAGDQAPGVQAIVSTAPTRAPEFTLTAHTGKRVGLREFNGKLRLLYFGYTHCPGICPTTLAEIAQALRSLSPEQATRVQPIMITVDPKRDTPERMAAYLSHFGPMFVGLTGTPEEAAAVAARYGIYSRVSEGTDGAGYAVDHTSLTIVVDQSGVVRLLFPYGLAAKAMAKDLRRLLDESRTP